MDQHEFDLHSYGITGAVRTCLTFLGVFPLIGLVALIDMQTETIVAGQTNSLVAVIGLIGVLVLLFIGWLALLNMFPAVQTSAKGIRVQFFWFWWLFILWEDVIGLYRWQIGGKRIVIVVTKKLTPFHLIYGITYAEMLKPAFLISASIAKYDNLIRTMEDRTGKRLST